MSDGGDVWNFGELRKRLGPDVDRCSRRIDLDDERQIDRLCDFLKMAEQPALLGLVVIGRGQESGGGAGPLRRPRSFDAFARAIGPCGCDDDRAAGRGLDRDLDQTETLAPRERRALAKRATDDEAAATLVDLPGDIPREGVFGDAVLRERRRRRGQPDAVARRDTREPRRGLRLDVLNGVRPTKKRSLLTAVEKRCEHSSGPQSERLIRPSDPFGIEPPLDGCVFQRGLTRCKHSAEPLAGFGDDPMALGILSDDELGGDAVMELSFATLRGMLIVEPGVTAVRVWTARRCYVAIE